MITKFKIFEMKEYDVSDEDVDKSERNIRDHFKKYYNKISPSLIGANNNIFLSKAEKNSIRSKNLIKFAEEEQDYELLKMFLYHLKLIEIMKIKKDSHKYNL
jgi:hypothetical protein